MVLFVDSFHPDDSAVYPDSGYRRRLRKGAASGAEIILIEVIPFSAIVAAYIAHPHRLLYALIIAQVSRRNKQPQVITGYFPQKPSVVTSSNNKKPIVTEPWFP
jgi:hypothetical protein